MKKKSTTLIAPGQKIDLSKFDTDGSDGLEKDAIKKQTRKNLERISELQAMLYAEHKRSLLYVLQAIDAGGKDSTICDVFGSMNPQGCKVTSFKQPTALERDHDFLWRVHQAVPAKGDVAVFNRSHYEDVLVVRVHGLVPKPVWSERYEQINAFENLLASNDTHIMKFFLHISKDEQLKRFKDRLDEPSKNWKVSAGDYEERKLWDDYQKAFEDMLGKCSTELAPWHVIPSNHKWVRNSLISTLIVEQLEGLKMSYPKPVDDISTLRTTYF